MPSGLTRRGCLAGTLAIGTLSATPAHAFWGAVAVAIGNGALGFVGNAALSSALGSTTNRDIELAIDGAVNDLKAYIFEQTRAAILENEVRRLQANCVNVDRSLRDYAASKSKEPSALENAYQVNMGACTISERLGVAGIPTYAISVSQRAIILKELSDRKGDTGLLKSFRDELLNAVKFVTRTVNDHYDSLDPTKRLSEVDCIPNRQLFEVMVRPTPGPMTSSTGPGMPPPIVQCFVSVDGQRRLLRISPISFTAAWDAFRKSVTDDERAKIEQSLAAHRAEVNSKIIVPALEVAKVWTALAERIRVKAT